MKLCRFELLAEPEKVRSGIVYSGKVYETDGENPVAVREASDIRPLPPVGQPPSIRFFRVGKLFEEVLTEPDRAPLAFYYGNPTTLVGASQIVPYPAFASRLDFEAYLAIIVGEPAFNVTPEVADGLILGMTIVNVLIDRGAEMDERRVGIGPGRSHDIAVAVGPVITTPDEINDAVVDEARGLRYQMAAVARVNGVEVRRGDLNDLPFSFAELLSFASESCVVHPGDVIAMGPVARSVEDSPTDLEAGDEVQIAVDRLGTLSTKIGQTTT